MANTNISEIYESFSQVDTNRRLVDGWVIVAVVSGNRTREGSAEVGPIYVLGKPADQGAGFFD